MTLTYPEVGRTLTDDLPAGYHHVRRAARLGTGGATFEKVAAGMRDWQIHKLAGLRVRTGGVPVEGEKFETGIGPIWAPCLLVWVKDEPHRYGIGFGRAERAFARRLEAEGSVQVRAHQVVLELGCFIELKQQLFSAGGRRARRHRRAEYDRKRLRRTYLFGWVSSSATAWGRGHGGSALGSSAKLPSSR